MSRMDTQTSNQIQQESYCQPVEVRLELIMCNLQQLVMRPVMCPVMGKTEVIKSNLTIILVVSKPHNLVNITLKKV